MGSYNSIPDNTATQSLFTREINLNDYYRNDPIREINVTATQSLSIKQIDLNNYYKNDPRRKIIRCQICKLEILRKDVFKHTISRRHKYNKLFIAVSQNRCPNRDVDFIVLDIDRLACRYCDFRLMIDSDSDDLIVSHIQGVRHIREKQASLNGIGFDYASVSSAGCSNKLLQPLDSFVTHDVKNRKRMKKKVPKIQKKADPLVKLEEMLKEQKVVNNAGQNTDQRYSLISGYYQRMWGKELPKCITIREGESYICTICCIEIPKDTQSLGIHINGRKHTRKTLNQSMEPEIIHVDKLWAGFRIEETVTDLKNTNSIVEKNIPQSSAVYQDEMDHFEKELEDCISLGVNGIPTCTACGTGIPNTPKNINEHLNGEKHKKKILKLIESKKQKSKLEYVKKFIPAPVDVRDTDNIVGNNIPQSSAVYQDEMDHFEKELEDCISLAVNGISTCMVCGTKMPAASKTVNDHLNGKKHKLKIVKLIESEKQKLELKDVNKLLPAPVDFKDTNNIVENNIPQRSAVYQDELAQFRKEFKDCISLGVNGISTCTVCGTEIPNAPKNINEHLNGKKHEEKIVKLIESKKQKLKLEYEKKLIPTPVSMYKCTICNVSMPNRVNYIKSHKVTKRHVKMMLQQEC